MAGTSITQKLKMLMEVGLDSKSKIVLKNELTQVLLDAHAQANSDLKKADTLFADLAVAVNSAFKKMGKPEFLLDIENLMGKKNKWSVLANSITNNFVDALDGLGAKSKQLGDDFAANMTKAIDIVGANLDTLVKQLNTIITKIGSTGQGINTSKYVKSIDQIDAAVNRIGKTSNRVQKLLQFDSAIDNIEELHKALDKIYLEQKASDFATLPWEDQYKLKTKFMEGYRQYEKLISNQNTKQKHRLDKDLTGLYNELLPAEHDMKNMLLNVQNRIDGKRLVGYENTGNQPWAKESTLKDIKNILESGIKVKDTDKKPTKASNDTKPKAAKATTENKSKYHAMGRSDAIKYITDHYDYDLWEDWYTRSDGKAREKIAELLKNDQKLRNAALNQMWDDYKKKTGSDVAFEEFLNTPIPMYRGVGKHSATDGVLSFSLNKKTAMANAEDAASVIEILMKPIETLGNARPLIGPSSEAEVMIAPEQLASYKDQEKVLVTYQKLNEEVEQYCKLKRQVIAHQNKGADIDQFIPLLRAGEDTIAKHFDVNNPEPTLSRDGIKMMLQAYPAGGVGIDTMLNTMAKSLGIEVPQASQKAEDSLEELNTRFTETQEKIKQTTKIISNQKEWLEYLGTVLDDKNFATSGKKQATEQLRDATHKLISYRRDPEQYKSYQYAEEMKMVAWQKAYDEAQKQGVASSTLTKYYTDALGSGKALKTLQDENDRRLKTLHQYEDQLARLKQTADQTKASIDAFNTSLSGKQSAKDSKEIANLKQIVDGAAGRDNVHGQTLTSVAQVAPDTDQKTTIAAAIGTQVAQDSTLQEISTKIDNIKAADNSTLESVLQEVKGVLEQIQLNTKSAVADVDSPSESVEDARLVEIDQQLKAIDIQLEKMPDSARRITNEEYVGLVSQRQALEASKLNLDDVSSSKDSYALESTLQAVKSVLEQNGSGVTKIIDAINEMVKTIGESGVKHATSSQSKGDNAVTSSSTVSSKNTETFSTKIKRLHNMYAAVGKFSAQIEGDPNNNVAEAKLNNTKELIKLKEKELGLDQEQLGVLHKELAATEQLAKEQEAKIVEAKHKQRDYQQQVKESRDQARVNRANSMLNTGRNTLDSLFQIHDDSIDFGAIEAAHKLSVALETLEQTRNRINQKGGLVDPQDAELLRAQTSEVQKYNTAVKQLVNNYTAVTSDHSEVVQGLQYQDTNSLVDMERQLRAAAMAATDGKIKIKSFDHANKSVTGTVKTGAHEMTDYTIAVRDLGNAFVKTAGKTHRAETFLEASKRKLSQISSYFSAMSVIGKASRSIKQGIQYIREIDSALTELRKVTDETEKTYDKFLDTAAKTADKVGSTIKDVVSSTADWARLGYSMQEAAKLAESTQILMNVSEFTDVNQATDSLISSIQAFKYTAEESMDVVDILNTIGNNYAISTADLAQSLTKSSGSLVAANGTLEEAVALTAAANTIIQDADVVGTALKTVAMRIRGTSVEEMEAEGLDTEGVVSQSKLRSKVQALSGVDILTQTGDYKSTYEILSEIADVWEDMNDMEQAALLELLAGKRAGSVMSAILNNPDTLKDAFESANNAAGSALRENEKYLDSIQGRIDLFTNAVQTMWQNTLNDDTVKWFVDLGTSVIKFIDKVGMIPTALGAALAYFVLIKKNNPIQMFKDWGASMVDAGLRTKQQTVNLQNLTVQQQAAKLASEGLTQQQIQENLIKNNNITTDRAQLLAQEAVTNAKIKEQTVTANGILSDWAENKVTLSNTAVDWLEAQSTNAITQAKLQEALASKAITKQDYLEIAAKYGLLTATESLKLGVKGLATTIKTAISTNPIGFILTIITTIASLVMMLGTLKSSVEKTAEAAKEALTTYKNATDTLRQHYQTISDIRDDYEKLADGVDSLGNNVSLTTDEYARYNEIVNQIADMFPQMVTGYTDEGNAIIALKGDVEELTKAYEEEARAARDAILVEQDSVYNDLLNKATSKDAFLSKNDRIGYDDYIEIIKGYIEQESGGKSIYESGILNNKYYNIGLAKLKTDLGYEAGSLNWEADLVTLQALLRNVQAEAKAASSGVTSILNAYLAQDFDYAKLSNDAKNAVKLIIAQFDTEFYTQFESASQMEAWVLANLVKPLQDADVSANLEAVFNLQTEFNNGEVSIQDYETKIKEIIDLIDALNLDKEDEIIKAIRLVFDVDDNGKVDLSKQNVVKDLLKDEYDDMVVNLTKSDLDIVDKNLESWNIPYGTLLSWDELKDKIAATKAAAWEASTEFEKVSEAMDSIQDAYSTLNDVVTEYNKNGFLTLDSLQSLLSLEPEYLAALQMENGQLTINQSVLQEMVKARLAEAKATVIQSAMEQLHALAARTAADAVDNSATAAYNAVSNLGTYASALGTVAQDAIVAAGAVSAFNAAVDGAKANALVDQAEIDAIFSTMNNSLSMIDQLGANLSTSFNPIMGVDGGTGKGDGEDAIKDDWDQRVSKYERELALITNERDLIEAEIDTAEARGGKASAEYYRDLIENSNDEKELLEEKKAALEAYLAANEDTIDQETWTEWNNEINETAVAIKECEQNTIEWQAALREIDIHYFEQATNEVSRLGEELDFVNSLLEDEDVADENGNWSNAGVTRLGLYTERVGLAAAQAKRYQDEIKKLNEQYDKGEISDEQYQERLADLTSGLQDSIQAQQDARDGIVELNEARIDAIKEGIEKEIEAYEDYIDVVQEALDAERDLYDFKKDVAKQTKDIASLERRIAALSGSTNASDIAERRKLEAELLEAKEGLSDSYYDRSMDSLSQALDDEAEAYSEAQEKRIEELEAMLEDVETLVTNSIMDVMFNADLILAELNGIADTYGFELSPLLKKPWEDASAQAIAWKEELETSMTSGEYAKLIGEGGAITAFANGVATKMQGPWNAAQNAVQSYADFLTGTELGSEFNSTIIEFGAQIQTIIDKWNDVKAAANAAYEAQTRKVTVGGNPNVSAGSNNSNNNSGGNASGGGVKVDANVKALQNILNSVFSAGIAEDGVWGPKTESALKKVQEQVKKFLNYNTRGGIKPTVDGKFNDATREAFLQYFDIMATRAYNTDHSEAVSTYTNAKKKLPAAFHAKGTLGTKKDEWAITDESWIGEEITLAAGKNGQLQYLKKGSAVMPADISANLVEWGKLNPDMMSLNGTPNINLISNAVNKPELNLSFDALVKADRIDEGTLPEVKRFVQQEINSLVKKMNYALKTTGGR